MLVDERQQICHETGSNAVDVGLEVVAQGVRGDVAAVDQVLDEGQASVDGVEDVDVLDRRGLVTTCTITLGRSSSQVSLWWSR
ncbi:hypothetical protein [Nonomuraea sp. NPDC049141]|uniref:hypothetical protein n=1 Tax=Nonomuraea sp. NPDC049141 TaxID=3155500 RepID=UPI0033DC1EFF